jgi:type I restriction enzyme, S subunit
MAISYPAKGIPKDVREAYPGHESHMMVETPEGRLPEGWRVVRLDEMYQTASGGTPSRKCSNYYGGSVPWAKTKELHDGPIFETEECITEEGLANSSAKVFPKHTVLVAMYGANIGQLGVIVCPAATNQACCAIIPSSEGGPGWAYAYLMVRHERERLINLRAGAAQQNISQAIIRAFRILRPASVVLNQFEELVGPVLTQSFVLHQQNSNLVAQRDLLLPGLISGELSIATAEHEMEAVA